MTFKEYPIGCFHVDIAQVNAEEVRLYMYIAIDRTLKFAYVELHEKSTRDIAALCRNSFRLNPAAPLALALVRSVENSTKFCSYSNIIWYF